MSSVYAAEFTSISLAGLKHSHILIIVGFNHSRHAVSFQSLSPKMCNAYSMVTEEFERVRDVL